MSNVIKEYLKDEEGNVFSPVVSASSVFINSGSSLKNEIDTINSKTDGMSSTITISKTLTLKTSWIDTGILASDFNSTGQGLYGIKWNCSSSALGWYDENFGGICWIYTGNCNNTDADEIHMSGSGHARNNHWIKLRWIRQRSQAKAKLQIQADADWSTSATINFTFRRLM